MKRFEFGKPNSPTLGVSLAPLAVLLLSLPGIIIARGTDAVSVAGPWTLLFCAFLAVTLAAVCRTATRRGLMLGLRRSAGQILPAIPILVCIAMIATTWMISGIVPTLISYGLQILSPRLFLLLACAVSAAISVLTGSSWTTIATIGVAFMGIGEVMGYSSPWIAGAIISGAYFGDKVSPLSDTTVVASSAAGVDLFRHIRYMMVTTIPAFVIALTVFLCVGLFGTPSAPAGSSAMVKALESSFNITPWVLLIPLMTITLILLRVKSLLVLLTAALLGFAGIFIFQPDMAFSPLRAAGALWTGFSLNTGNASLDDLVATGGITGMASTIFLVTSAMIFGAAMIGTGMLGRITEAFTSSLRKRTSIVSATVGSGLAMNCLTADQYLSLIITGNMYRTLYRRFGLEARLLSRSMEDSVSVTSVLIPWNSCGLTQSTVLGVSTLAYFPCCIFNILSPVMTLVIAYIGYRIPQPSRQTPLAPVTVKAS